jgi:hypothetical protein
MNPPADAPTWLAWMLSHVNAADTVLVVLLIGAAWVVWMAQRREDFDFADMLKDDGTGKATPLRFAIIGSFAVSSWVVMHDTLASNLSDTQWVVYLVTWSGAAIMRVFAEKWDGRMPWVRGDAPGAGQNRPG